MRYIEKIIVIFLVSTLAIACSERKPSTTKTKSGGEIYVVTPIDFKEKSANQTIVDIRTPQEFVQGHIEGAVNISLYDRSFNEQILKLDKSKPIFIYCRSGSRTYSASKKIAKLGFEKVYDLQGGIINWVKSDLNITK